MIPVLPLLAAGVLGNSLPGSWRPFADDSPWNTPVSADAPVRAGSDGVLARMTGRADHLRFSREPATVLWVVSSADVPLATVRCDSVLDPGDATPGGRSSVPLDPSMAWECAGEGSLCIVDPARHLAWEMTRLRWPPGGTPTCATLVLRDLTGPGYRNPGDGTHGSTCGGRGSGFPLVAGLLHPEEVESGEIRHALVFTYPSVRRAPDGASVFVAPPACRADGRSEGETYPIEGMCFRLDPALGEKDFDAWGLTPQARVVARALQEYGMYLGDRGPAWELQPQRLADDPTEHRALWEERLPGFYRSIERIPTTAFRIVDRGGRDVVR